MAVLVKFDNWLGRAVVFKANSGRTPEIDSKLKWLQLNRSIASLERIWPTSVQLNSCDWLAEIAETFFPR